MYVYNFRPIRQTHNQKEAGSSPARSNKIGLKIIFRSDLL